MGLLKTYLDIPVKALPGNATDHQGKHLGKLTIMHPIRSRGAHLMWRADCECGSKVEIRASQIAISGIDSCGLCQTLHGSMLRELPYRINEEESGGQLPLEYEDSPAAGLTEKLDKVFDVTSGADKTPPTAWQVAEQCCVLLAQITGPGERIKAMQLIRVELGYEA